MFGHQRAEIDARNTKMNRGQVTHPIWTNFRYEMNWANSFFPQKTWKPCLQIDGPMDAETGGRTDVRVSPAYPHSTFGGAGVYKGLMSYFSVNLACIFLLSQKAVNFFTSTLRTAPSSCKNWRADMESGLAWKTETVFNPPVPSAVYMHWWTGSTLVQIMACRIVGAKPLSEPMLEFCSLDP